MDFLQNQKNGGSLFSPGIVCTHFWSSQLLVCLGTILCSLGYHVTVHKYCHPSSATKSLLTHWQRPLVLSSIVPLFCDLNIVLFTQLLTPFFTYCRSNRFDRIIMGPKKGASALKTIEYPPDCKEVSTELSKDELHRRLKVCYLC